MAGGPRHPLQQPHPRRGGAAGGAVLVIVAGRLAASGDLPRDPPPHDGPTAHVHDPLVGRPGMASALMGEDSVFGVEVSDDGIRRGRPTSAASRRAIARVARAAGVSLGGRAHRRVARERLQLPGEAVTGRPFGAIVGVTFAPCSRADGPARPPSSSWIASRSSSAPSASRRTRTRSPRPCSTRSSCASSCPWSPALRHHHARLRDRRRQIVYLLAKPIPRWEILAARLLSWRRWPRLRSATRRLTGLILLGGAPGADMGIAWG